MKRTYKLYKEENGKTLIDLSIHVDEDKFDVDEKIHKIHVKDLTSDELNQKLNELDIQESIKLEIKKGVLGKHIGLFEKHQESLADKITLSGDEKDKAFEQISERFKKLESYMKKELKELDDSMDDIFSNLK